MKIQRDNNMIIKYLTILIYTSFLLLAPALATAGQSPLSVSSLKSGLFPEHWINGRDCATEPKGQIHKYNEDLYIIRQSVCTNFEAPFIYLIFGQNKVLMQDSGASDFGQRQLVDTIVEEWLKRNKKESIELVISHSHGHGDHVAGDSLFEGRPFTQIIKKGVQSVKDYFSLENWPEGVSQIDLGDRLIDVLPLPGHQEAHIALYDHQTQILFTGDSLYPGRIYFKQSTFEQYKKSMKRLYQYTQTKKVTYVLGTHIEMTKSPGEDYPFEAKSHRNERQLQLTISHLKELVEAVSAMSLPVRKSVHDDFILYPTD